MDYYQPKLAHNQHEPLPLQFITYKQNFLWPLRPDASRLQYAIQNVGITISILCYVLTIVGEFTFMSENTSDIPAITECLSTSFMGIQYLIRILVLASRQPQMRALLQRFYSQIYFTAVDDSELYKQIRIITRLADFLTKIYFIPMILIFIMFAYDVLMSDLSSNNKPYIYRMSFRWYNAQTPLSYFLTSIYTGWLTASTVGLMSAEDFILCIMLCHTSYRYKEMQRDLRKLWQDACTEAKRTGGCDNVHVVFRRKLYRIFRRHQILHSFIDEAKSHFTYQIFFFLSFGVGLLCVVLFQFQRTTIGINWVKYVIWLISQTAQFIMIGYFGQMLMDETTAMKDEYYMCQWELVLPHGDWHANKLLMQDIRFAIMNAEKAVVFEGMKMVPLTHSTVGSALRSAMSYFMFLNTMNDANKSK